MNLPKVVTDLIKTQNNFDSVAYANCFTETAVVFDEGQTHNGRKEIEKWIDEANKKYQATMKPMEFETTGENGILTTEVSGTFEGSPLVLKYHIQMKDGLIQSLNVTG